MSSNQAINNLKAKIVALDSVIDEVSRAGYASATLSAGGGSKSYTRLDLDDLNLQRSRYIRRLRALQRGSAIRTVKVVRI